MRQLRAISWLFFWMGLSTGCPNNFGNPWSSVPDPSEVGDGGNAVSRSCSETHLFAHAEPMQYGDVTLGRGSTVLLGLSATDCQGHPFTGLTPADFTLEEDGAPQSAEASLNVYPGRADAPLVYLVLDVSSSTTPVLTQLQAGAKALAKKLLVDEQVPAEIVVFSFAGYSKQGVEDQGVAGYLARVGGGTDIASVEEALGRISNPPGDYPRDAASTALYGATQGSIEAMRGARTEYMKQQAAGAFRAGYVVLFTDGADTTNTVSIGEVGKAYEAGNERVMAVALAGSDYTPAARNALSVIAPDGVYEATQPDGLSDAFDRIGGRIAGEYRGSYVLAYCAPARANKHRLQVGISGAGSMPSRAQLDYDASGFSESSTCYGDKLDAQCVNKECGALCGVCKVGQNAACRSFRCDHDNPQFPVAGACLPLLPNLCGAQCVDNGEMNCGGCGIACPAGQICYGLSCGAPPTVVPLANFASKAGLMGIDGGYVYVYQTKTSGMVESINLGRIPVAGGSVEWLTGFNHDDCISPVVSGGKIYCVAKVATQWGWELRGFAPGETPTRVRDWPAGLTYYAGGNVSVAGVLFEVKDGEVLLGKYSWPTRAYDAWGRGYPIHVGRMSLTGTDDPRFVFKEESGVDRLGVMVDIGLLGVTISGGDTIVTYERREQWGSSGGTLVEGVTTTVTPAQGEVSGLSDLPLIRVPKRPELKTIEAADARYVYAMTYASGLRVLDRTSGAEVGATIVGQRSISDYYNQEEPWNGRVVSGNVIAVRGSNADVLIGTVP